MFNNNSTPFTMPVIPASGSGYGNGGGMWGDGAWWIVIFVLFFAFGGFSNGFGGWGGNGTGLQGIATRADINEGFALNGIENGIRGIQQGICDSTYAISQQFHGVDNAICNLGYQTQQGFNQTNVALMQGQNALASQLANCCCDQREATSALRYDLATQACDTRHAIADSTRDIIDNANANSRQLLDFLVNDKISTLTAENQSLKAAANIQAQNAYITANQDAQTAEIVRRLGKDYPVNAVVVQPPTPITFPVNGCGNFYGFNGYGSGCTCGCA